MSAESTVKEVTLEDGLGVVLYESDMPIGALKSVLGAANTGDLGSIIEGLARFIIEWPFEGEPTDPAAWENLRRSQFTSVITSVMEDLQDEGKE